ncbi:hypothetical protein, partial [Gorillibacterium sp. sgz5001074]|uniref:hypothetical protein n=1 Tax=Gorillibacterium sp. sgz5001074 TaxID=3446695 RepID=UPI003F663CA3
PGAAFNPAAGAGRRIKGHQWPSIRVRRAPTAERENEGQERPSIRQQMQAGELKATSGLRSASARLRRRSGGG